MASRTDPHRPGAIVPDDYEYVGQECLKIECLADCYVLQAERETIRAQRGIGYFIRQSEYFA